MEASGIRQIPITAGVSVGRWTSWDVFSTSSAWSVFLSGLGRLFLSGLDVSTIAVTASASSALGRDVPGKGAAGTGPGRLASCGVSARAAGGTLGGCRARGLASSTDARSMLRFRARALWLYGWPADELVGRRRARPLSRPWTRGLLSACEPTVGDQQPSPIDAVVWPSGPLLHLARSGSQTVDPLPSRSDEFLRWDRS